MQGQFSPRGHLLDMRAFAGAVIALDQHAAVVREAGQDRLRGLAVEAIGRIDVGHVVRAMAERRHADARVDAEHRARVDLGIGQVVAGARLWGGARVWDGGHLIHRTANPVV